MTMTRSAFKKAIDDLESYYRPRTFGDGEVRRHILEATFKEVMGCADSSVQPAVTAIIQQYSSLPPLSALIREVQQQNLSGAVAADRDQEKRAEDYKRYGRDSQGPLPSLIKEMLDGLAEGTITRREWIANLEVLDAQNGTEYAKEYIAYLDRLSKIKNTDLDHCIVPSWHGEIQ